MTMRKFIPVPVGQGSAPAPVRVRGVLYPPHLLLWDMKQEGALAVRERVLRAHDEEREAIEARAQARRRARRGGAKRGCSDAAELAKRREEALEVMAQLATRCTQVRLVR